MLRNFIGFFVILLFSLCFHEYAHGLVAKWKGDPTAEQMGRLTLSPFPHMDLTGTVILPAITIFMNAMGASLPFFGWAKPVPVNVRNLQNPRKDMFWIALAGPASNILLALIGTFILIGVNRYVVGSSYYRPMTHLIQQFMVTNLFLAFFNLIPVNPLDGGRIVSRFLPRTWAYRMEQYESMTSLILLGVIFLGGLKWLAIPVLKVFSVLLGVAYGI